MWLRCNLVPPTFPPCSRCSSAILVETRGATTSVYFLLCLALTTALTGRSLLWCKGKRHQGLTLICSPVVSLNLVYLWNVIVLRHLFIPGVHLQTFVVFPCNMQYEFCPPAMHWWCEAHGCIQSLTPHVRWRCYLLCSSQFVELL